MMAVALGGCREQPAGVKVESGEAIYMARCAVCHGESGEGKPGVYPPVAGSQWVSGPPERLAAILLDGMQGQSGGYNGVMPGWHGVMTETEIASVMTWLRKAPVSAVQVNHVYLGTEGRNTFWTPEDLRNLRVP